METFYIKYTLEKYIIRKSNAECIFSKNICFVHARKVYFWKPTTSVIINQDQLKRVSDSTETGRRPIDLILSQSNRAR